MVGTVTMTHSLGLAVAATALLAAEPSTALAQSSASQVQEPSRPATSAATGKDASRDRASETLSLFSRPRATSTTSKSVKDSWLSGLEIKCLACGGSGTSPVFPESTNPNAPWVLQGTWRRQTAFGIVSTGILGVRNSALPVSALTSLGGSFEPGHNASASSAFAPSSQWYLTAAVEKTLAVRSDGASVGVIADVLIPVESKPFRVVDPRSDALTSRALRVGMVVRW